MQVRKLPEGWTSILNKTYWSVCSLTDLKHDNILFRPPDLLAVISHELIESPSLTYDCGTLVNPPIIPVRSQSLPLSPDAAISENELDVVLADVGHCKSPDLLRAAL